MSLFLFADVDATHFALASVSVAHGAEASGFIP